MIGVPCVLVAAFILPATDPIAGTPYSRRFLRFDYAGSTLFTAAITCLVMGIAFGGALFPWSSGRIIALFVVAGLLITSFGLQQTYLIFTRLEDRIFPVQFVKNRNAVLLFISTAAVNTACFVRKYNMTLLYKTSELTIDKQFTTSRSTCKQNFKIGVRRSIILICAIVSLPVAMEH